MPASFGEVVVEGGLPGLKCPVTGVDVYRSGDGFDSSADHSPYLRVFVDWVGGVWAADPVDLSEEQCQTQRDLIEIFENSSEDELQNDLVERCVRRLPESAVVFEILDPPVGSFTGEICYAMFDFGAPAKSARIKLRNVA